MHADKKMIVMLALIIIAISMTGVAVAYWSSNIRIESTAHMANMTLVFDSREPPICTEFRDVEGVMMPGELYDNVGETTCCYQGVITNPDTGELGYENMIMTIENAYPDYRVHLTFIVHNIGQIPVDISGVAITDPTEALTWDDMQGALVDDNGEPIINIEHVNLVGEQIVSCMKEKGEFDFRIMQGAQEGYTYYFEIEILYSQQGYSE